MWPWSSEQQELGGAAGSALPLCPKSRHPQPAGPPHLQAAALIGAVVTGVLARRRRVETQTLNDKLRQINAELRRQREKQVRMYGCPAGCNGCVAPVCGDAGPSSI